MENFKYAAEGAWKVLAVGMILGAGLPAVFALGIRSLALGTDHLGGTAAEGHDTGGASAVGMALAGLCFAVVIVAVALGITEVIASGMGKAVSFAHVFPTLKDK